MRRDRESLIPDFASTRRMPGRRFSIRVFPLGRPLVGLAFEDITARKAAEDALARSNDELTQFAFVASHDLQAPLRKAAAFAEQVRRRLGPRLDDASGDFLRRMTGSLEGMQALIDALLALAQVSSRATSWPTSRTRSPAPAPASSSAGCPRCRATLSRCGSCCRTCSSTR